MNLNLTNLPNLSNAKTYYYQTKRIQENQTKRSRGEYHLFQREERREEVFKTKDQRRLGRVEKMRHNLYS